MEIRIRTLTPIWTGDINRQCTKLRETSILGSLRWWFEALVRGLGGYACDPTSEDRCKLDQKKFQRSTIKEDKFIQEALNDQKICPACQLFGCTGWSRRFRLEVDKLTLVNLKFVTKIKCPSFRTDLKWWINKTLGEYPVGFYGETKLNVISSYKEIEDIVLFLLKLISSAGGFCAKTQNGFGIFIIKDVKKKNIEDGYNNFQNLISKSTSLPKSHNFNLPNFSNFFKIDVKIRDINAFKKKLMGDISGSSNNYILSGFAIKYLLRTEFKNLRRLPVTNFKHIRDACNNIVERIDDEISKLAQMIKKEGNKKRREKLKEKRNKLELLRRKYNPRKVVARYLFGSDLEKEKWASRINISHVYKVNSDFYFRIWGEIPPLLDYDNDIIVKFDRDKVIEQIKSILESCFGSNVLEFGEIKFKDQLLEEVLE